MQKKRILSILGAVLLINVYWIWQFQLAKPSTSNLLQIYFLDVGQGDAILVKSPDNKYLLIDGGKGQRVIDELSQVMFQHALDVIISTHPDADHLEGIYNILKQHYQVGEIFWNQITSAKSNLFLSFKTIVADFPNSSLSNYSEFKLGCCVNVAVLWPPPNSDFAESNDNSITIHLSYEKFDMFSGGDLPSNREDALINQLESDDYEVLKVSHHGTKYSTSDQLLDVMQPEVAVISVGKGNTYGHPANETLARLAAHQVATYRTDEDGRVEISTDGKSSYEVDTLKTLEKKEFKL